MTNKYISNLIDSDASTLNPIAQAALKVYSREELQNLSKITRMNFLILLERKLKENPNAIVAELEGVRELVEDYLTHPAIERWQSQSNE